MQTEAANGRWMSLEEVMDVIVRGGDEPRIAFAISGGGATGAYEAGAIAAWLQTARERYGGDARKLMPKLVVGSSAGALNATTLLVELLRPSPGADFGYQVWRAICPRAASFVVGGRSWLVDLATRWMKLPLPRIVRPKLLLSALGLAALVVLVALLVYRKWIPLLAVAGAIAVVAIVLGVLFHRAVFGNHALMNTLANVLRGGTPGSTAPVSRRFLARSADVQQASRDLVESWWTTPADERPGYILTSTDLSSGDANLFTLVDKDVYARLGDNGWQTMQLANAAARMREYPRSIANCGWVDGSRLIDCIVASTSIPGVFPSRRILLQSIDCKDLLEHDFVDGGVLNNSPIHIALDAGATHIVSFELEPLTRHVAFNYVAEGPEPNIGRNLAQTFETLLSHSTTVGIRSASAWNRQIRTAGELEARGKRLVPIFRTAPRRRDLNLIDFDGHYRTAFSRPDPTLAEWLDQGARETKQGERFWDATFEADPTTSTTRPALDAPVAVRTTSARNEPEVA